MPIYEYQCQTCGHKLEALQKFSDEPLTHCPQCKEEKLAKLVSAAGFQLKGSGWYVTDYSKKGKSKEESSSGTANDTKTKETSGKSTETKQTSGKSGDSTG